MADSSSGESEPERKIRKRRRDKKSREKYTPSGADKGTSKHWSSDGQEIDDGKAKNSHRKHKRHQLEIKKEPIISDEEINLTIKKESALRERLKQKYMEREKRDNNKQSSDEDRHKSKKSKHYDQSFDRHKDHSRKQKHRKHEYESRSEIDRHRTDHHKESYEHRDRYDSSDEGRHKKHDNRSRKRSDPQHHQIDRQNHEREWDRGKTESRLEEGPRGSGPYDRVNSSSESFGNKKKAAAIAKEEPNFKLSGKLTEYTNTYNGVVILYNEPVEARKPKTRWRLYPFKGEQALTMLQLHRQSAFLFGRDRKVADIPVDHPSCSKQHSVMQFRLVDYERTDGARGRRVKPYIIDLESTNGTFVNNKKVEPRRYVELLEKDVLKFGFSSREYVLLHEKSQDDDGEEPGTDEEVDSPKDKDNKTEKEESQ